MKAMNTTFTKILLCLALLTMIGKATAQETFAPLISENCVAFVHVDFRNVELDEVKNDIQKIGEGFLRTLAFDNKSFTATAKEIGIELEKLVTFVRPTFDTITKELGIREIAFIVDMELIEETPPVIAIPWKNKTEKQFETLHEMLTHLFVEHGLNAEIIKTDGFLLLNPNQEATMDWAKALKPAAPNAPIFEALKSVAGKEIKVAVALPQQVRDFISNLSSQPDMPAQVKNFIIHVSLRTDWASASLSLATLLGKEPAKDADVFLTIKMAKPNDALMVQGGLENLIELAVDTARLTMQQEARGDVPLLFQSPLTLEFVKGCLRMLLPDVEEDKLLFRAKAMQGNMNIQTIGIGVALLLPAVQAAREAARRAQCINNIKQVTYALLNYEHTTNAFPPLYTVDKDGKPLHSWRVLILPFIEQQALYKAIRLDEPWNSEHNKQFHNVVIPGFQCPNNPNVNGTANCNYSGIAGEVFKPPKEPFPSRKGSVSLDHIMAGDGTSATIAVVETKEAFCWMNPTADMTLDDLAKGINVPGGRAGSTHPGGCNVGFCDQAVRFMSESVEKQILRALGAIDSGGIVNPRDL
jgi:prepilin-type processing-associated H-X9-DG protein